MTRPRRRSIEASRVRPGTFAGFTLSERVPIDEKSGGRKASNANFMTGWLRRFSTNVNPRHRGRPARRIPKMRRRQLSDLTTVRPACSGGAVLIRGGLHMLDRELAASLK